MEPCAPADGEPPPPLPIALRPVEEALLRAAARGARGAVEYGCGGSTPLLLAEVERLVSVDSDATWLERAGLHPTCAVARAAGRWTPVLADIGPLSGWGWPATPEGFARGADYAAAPWPYEPEPDFVFVDGRFRVACGLAALRRLRGHPGCGRLAVHDFWDRAHYRALLRWASVEATAGSLAILAPRGGVPPDLPEFGCDPR